MSKKRKIDYIIEERDNRRLIFRFYPRQSSCHSFGNEPPKSWDEVYKVYYSYAIISQWKHEPDSQWESDVKYYEHCDESSIIDEIAQRCLLLADGYETFEREDGERIPLLDKKVFPFGTFLPLTTTGTTAPTTITCATTSPRKATGCSIPES